MTEAAERLILPDAIRAEIIAHARDHAPRECCGIIAAKNGELTQLHRLTNTEPGNTRYLFDDEESARTYVEEHTARLEGFGVTDIRAKVFQVNEPLTELTRGPVGD